MKQLPGEGFLMTRGRKVLATSAALIVVTLMAGCGSSTVGGTVTGGAEGGATGGGAAVGGAIPPMIP
ncbi:hypothetical protein AWC29_27495 [Mycobacterium triplex]|uniref:Uncharacterized protein n=2 Tax=Mycobacterium triplex TaxID=47839 RepID=A0ABX3VWJ7_9MYCO|nr:hypothetical protein AWC29_27495 [Mycobacterium triplex]